jgi:glutamyl-tRNA synthetase
MFLAQPQQPDAKAAALLTPEAKTLLTDIHEALAGTDFTVPDIDSTLRAFAEAHGMKLGQIAQPLRVALTGSTVSPGIDATLAALGKDESLARIAAAGSTPA